MSIIEPGKELEINEQTVRELVYKQFSDMCNLPIKFLNAGWDNKNYKLGSNFLVRLPRRLQSAKLIENEIKWLSHLESKLPIQVPTPIKIGQPTSFYPWKWTINPWIEGFTSDIAEPNDSEALSLVNCLKNLHQNSPANGPINPYRGVDLEKKAKDVESRIKRLKLKTTLITPKIEQYWKLALSGSKPHNKCLIHGDLHPLNIIVREKKIKAIIDWGDITLGDPACDLASLWMINDNNKARQLALKDYGASQILINRSIGWAIFFGTLFLDSAWDKNKQQVILGKKILQNINESKIEEKI